MMNIYMYIRSEIDANIDEKYKNFQSSLCPNIKNIEGVRVPILRDIALTISKKEEIVSYLEEGNISTYEERNIYGFVIGYLKTDLKIYQRYLKKFIPMIDNWATCDMVCSNLKFTKKYKKEMYSFICSYLKGKKEYEVRFAIVMLMNYYLEEDTYQDVFQKLLEIKNKAYYVQMAEAWLLSICYIRYKEETLTFLKRKDIDSFVLKKTLQKIRESTRVSKQEKEFMKTFV